MAAYTTHDIRNVALVGHAGAGKTLLAEALLAAAGAIGQRGELTRGTTVSDHDPMEREHQHSINTSVCHLDYQGKHINLIDTPGTPDLMGRAQAVLPAVETVAVVIDAQTGIGTGTRQMMAAAAERGLCRMIIINRIDLPGTDLPALVGEVRALFGEQCLAVNLPAEDGARVLDCFFKRKGDATDFASVEDAHRRVVEQVVEEDDALMEVYLEEDREPSMEQLHAPFEQGLREGHLIPVCFVSAETGAGVQELLDILAQLAPDPTEANPPPFVRGEERRPQAIDPGDADGHVVAHVFKVSIDPYMGRLGMFRMHQGTVRTGAQLFVGDHRKPIKLAHVYKIQGKELIEVGAAIPGDICAIAKLDELFFDAVLHDSHDEDELHMRSVSFMPPMVGVAIEAERPGDEAKLSEALHRIEADDPSLRITHSKVTNETAIYGLGELHLRMVLQRMRDQHKLDVTTHPPSIPYKESITASAEGHHRHKKQTGGAGQFGEVHLRVEPLPRGTGFEFVSEVVGGAVPATLVAATEKGVREVLASGAIAGYPLEDVRVVVHDGKTHSVDSKEIAFVTAGRKAFIDAVAKAKPIVLEPVVDISIEAPADTIGAISGDLSSMRGRITSQDIRSDGMALIEGQVPLAEVIGYHTSLKSHTAGQGSYRISFSHHDPVPREIQARLVEGFKHRDED